MPFIAVDKESGERVNLIFDSVKKADLFKRSFVCPVCGEPLVPKTDFFRQGYYVRSHFAHKPSEKCLYAQYSTGETEEHRVAKVWLLEYLQEVIGKDFDVEFSIEHYVKAASRIADVAVLFPGGYLHAFEIQLASISVEELVERTQSYLDAGCEILWMLGNRADTMQNRRWLISAQGHAPIIKFEYGVEEVTVNEEKN